MSDVAAYLKRTAERTKYKREFFIEQNMPTNLSNVLAIPFYGDIRSTFILSSLILRSYKDLHKDKYIILCSWPGFHGLFPYVDEYWCIDESLSKTLASEANSFYNGSNLATDLSRSLLEFLEVMTHRDLKKYHNRGFTDEYWNTFKTIQRYLPEVPSDNKLTDTFKNELNRGSEQKVVVYPVTRMWSWQKGKGVYLTIPKEFWTALFERLLDEGITPVVYQNGFTFDMSRDFADKCIYLVPRNITDVLAAFRSVGCVLDVHSGISRLAIAARTPFVAVDERIRFIELGDYAIDDLCCDSLPRKYIFSFSTMLMTGGRQEWKLSVIDNIITQLKSFIPSSQDQEWGSTAESYESVSYDRVRKRKARRMGVHFIGSAKDK